MKTLSKVILALQLLITPISVTNAWSADSVTLPPPDQEARELFRQQGRLIPSELASPWTEARTWLLIGAGATAALAVLRPQIVDPVQDYFSDRKPLGSFSQYGNFGGLGITNVLYSVGMWTHFVISRDPTSFRRGASMIKLTFYSESTTFLLKSTTHSRRPDGRDTLSFPSGHATAAFAFAAYITAEHGWAWGAPALGLATLSGLSRMNDNRHFLHDVVAGTTIGTVWALGVHAVQAKALRTAESSDSPATASIEWFPIVSEGTYGLGAALEF